jgi:hypothetical protein
VERVLRVSLTLGGNLSRVLLQAILTLTTAVLAPIVCLATIVLLPFSDRKTQAALLGSWASYLALVGVVLL